MAIKRSRYEIPGSEPPRYFDGVLRAADGEGHCPVFEVMIGGIRKVTLAE